MIIKLTSAYAEKIIYIMIQNIQGWHDGVDEDGQKITLVYMNHGPLFRVLESSEEIYEKIQEVIRVLSKDPRKTPFPTLVL